MFKFNLQFTQNIFSKFLCLIIENGIDSKKVASEEIVHFAEKLGMTDCDEFNLFHQTICPDLPVSAAKTDIEEQTINTEQLEANKAELEELRKKAQLAAQKAAKLESEMKKVKANQQAVQKAKKLEKDLLEVKKKEKETQELLLEKDKEMGALKTKNRELIKNADRHAREKAEMLARQPQGVDYIEVSISQFMNTGLRIHLAGWLEAKFSQICGTNYWNKKIKAVLTADEKENFSLKTELTDFSIDALFNIYYRNLRDFYDYESMAKQEARGRIHEMQMIRNRWVGHYSESEWTRDTISKDLATIKAFTEQIEMPAEKCKKYFDFEALSNYVNNLDLQ